MSRPVLVYESGPSRRMKVQGWGLGVWGFGFTEHTRQQHRQAPWREVAPRIRLYTSNNNTYTNTDTDTDTHTATRTDAQRQIVHGDWLACGDKLNPKP